MGYRLTEEDLANDRRKLTIEQVNGSIHKKLETHRVKFSDVPTSKYQLLKENLKYRVRELNKPGEQPFAMYCDTKADGSFEVWITNGGVTIYHGRYTANHADEAKSLFDEVRDANECFRDGEQFTFSFRFYPKQ